MCQTQCKRLARVNSPILLRCYQVANIIDIITTEFSVRKEQTEHVIALLDDGKTVYNVEMQTTFQEAPPQRARYYQAHIDVNQLERGAHYDQLKPSFVIFICKFDPFGKNLYRYSFQNVCREDETVKLQDEAYKLFFNTKGECGDITPGLQELLRYMNDTDAFPVENTDNALIRKIEHAVEQAKQDDDWRRAYMTYQIKQRDAELRGEQRGYLLGERKAKELTAKNCFIEECPTQMWPR